MKPLEFIETNLLGLSQIMLQKNVLTGILFLLGLLLFAWQPALGAIIGVIVATITAIILRYNKNNILSGLYGCNAALVGIGVLYFFQISIISIILLIIGAIASTIIMEFMLKKNWHPFTFPFVLVGWILIILIKYLKLVPAQTYSYITLDNSNLLTAFGMSFAQVMLQASFVTGIIFFIAILVNSTNTAGYAVLGAGAALLIATTAHLPNNMVVLGFFGFNAVLCGIAFAGKKIEGIIYAIIASALSVLMMYGFIHVGIIALTAPFVFATWITLGLKKAIDLSRKKKKSKN